MARSCDQVGRFWRICCLRLFDESDQAFFGWFGAGIEIQGFDELQELGFAAAHGAGVDGLETMWDCGCRI